MKTPLARTLIFSVSLILGLGLLGATLGKAVVRFRTLERTVTVKGLSEREYPADVIISPLPIIAASDDAPALYALLDRNAQRVKNFFTAAGIREEEISVSIPNVIDKLAREYNSDAAGPRYSGRIAVTIYSTNVAKVQESLAKVGALGREGIILQLGVYDNTIQYLFTRLNEVKPEMLQEASANAREAAHQLSKDAGARLGRLKTTSQGQFSITPRDSNTPHLKTVRVVTSAEYYLD